MENLGKQTVVEERRSDKMKISLQDLERLEYTELEKIYIEVSRYLFYHQHFILDADECDKEDEDTIQNILDCIAKEIHKRGETVPEQDLVTHYVDDFMILEPIWRK